jgi:predicted phage baseplate assembly protein
MISRPPPQIDTRSTSAVTEQLVRWLHKYAGDWNDFDPATGAPKGMSAGLIGVSARFADVLIQRLNQVPQKNFLAFLDLQGAALLPPQPARVPLTFLLAKGSLVDALVPLGTQVAAAPGPGEKDPVIYETEDNLVVTAAQLQFAFARDPGQDTYADYSDDLIAIGSPATSIFRGNRRIAHVFYLGQSGLLDSERMTKFTVVVDLKPPPATAPADGIEVKWELWDGIQWSDITPQDPAKDGTKRLSQSGTIDFGKVPVAGITAVQGMAKEWVRCRLLTPITPETTARAGMARADRVPEIRSIGMRVHLQDRKVLFDQAYASASGDIDLSKDFYPFGEKPKFGDAFWLTLPEDFGRGGAKVTISVNVTSVPPSPGAAGPTPPVAVPSEDIRLRWEGWNGKAWVELGTSTRTGVENGTVNGNAFSDSTKALSQKGDIVFTLPPQMARFSLNGKTDYWIRVRIASGNYGVEGHFVPEDSAVRFKFVPANFTPPSIKELFASYDVDRPLPPATQTFPEAVITENDFIYEDRTAENADPDRSFVPFAASQDLRPTLYVGFLLPPARSFPNRPITMFFDSAHLRYGQRTAPLFPDESQASANAGDIANHRFTVTNDSSRDAAYGVDAIGSQWKPVIKSVNPDGSLGAALSSISLSAGKSADINVQVTVPANAAIGAVDSGIVRLVSAAGSLAAAEFVTTAAIDAAEAQEPQLTWEYRTEQEWAGLTVRDDTANLTTSGAVEFLAPADFVPHSEMGVKAWWIRVRWDAGDFDMLPRLARVLLNTTMAAQTVTIRDEKLGSSDGSAGQRFVLTRAPVLTGQRLMVREPEMPTGDDLTTIVQEEGAQAIMTIPGGAGKADEIWVTWHEVTDFYASRRRSRHYVFDHIAGVVSFGDGRSGMIPPTDTANIRLSMFKTGGGVRGNKPAGSIVQLKTTIPYLDKVTNHLEAAGGADAESMDSLIARAPTEIRHRRRAVTKEDYEDIARLASPDVARALCVPNRDLTEAGNDKRAPGKVSVIIVPNATDPRPQPSRELARRVQRFMSASCPVTATVIVVSAPYLRVDVRTEIGLRSLEDAATVTSKVQDALRQFLHPLTGGPDGNGWEFGREPHRSDIYGMIEKIPEVGHIRALKLDIFEDFPGARETGRFLVYSGIHSIALKYVP